MKVETSPERLGRSMRQAKGSLPPWRASPSGKQSDCSSRPRPRGAGHRHSFCSGERAAVGVPVPGRSRLSRAALPESRCSRCGWELQQQLPPFSRGPWAALHVQCPQGPVQPAAVYLGRQQIGPGLVPSLETCEAASGKESCVCTSVGPSAAVTSASEAPCSL